MKAINRFFEYLDFKGIKPTRFEKEAGLSNGYLGTQLKRNADLGESILNKLVDNCLDLNFEWLIFGKGDMLKSEKPTLKPYDTDSHKISMVAEPAVSRYTLRSDYFNTDRQQIPLYEIDAAAGLTTLFSSQNSQVPLDHISVPNAPKCDGAIFVRGDSMYPILKSGDIVCYKTIFNIENMIFGEMYLLDIDNGDDQYLTVKFVNKIEGKDDYVLLVSENKYHAPKEIPVSQIRALAIIKLSIRYNAIS